MPGFSQSWSLVYRASGRAIWFLEVSLSLSLLELELLVGKSSFHRPFARSYLHVQKRSGSLLLWTTCFTVTPIHDLVYNSTNHEVNLYFPPHLPPPSPPVIVQQRFQKFQFVHWIIKCIIGDIEYEKSLRNRKWSSRERIWREGNFRPVPNANGVSTSSLWKNLCIPVDKPPRSFVWRLSFLSCGQSQ